ncbi:MAG: hypothetical protein WKF58_01980 [Ilumatobacteraceae bacterium]
MLIRIVVGEPHRHLCRSVVAVVAARSLVTADLCAVGDRQEIGLDDERHLERGLEIGLVPAGEGSAAVRRLHLRGGDDALVAVLVTEGAAIEAAQLVVEDARELDPHGGATRLERAVDVDGQPLGRLVERPRRRRAVHGARADVELDRVEDELADRLDHVDVDLDDAPERRGVEVWLELDPVRIGHGRPGQSIGVERVRTGLGVGRHGRRWYP